jgi:hypothetical protein
MGLFIADDAFYFYEEKETDAPALPPLQRVEIRFRMAITEPTVTNPPETPVFREFVLDTAADYANVFPADLEASGIPLEGPSGGEHPIILWDGSIAKGHMRDVTLWLYSNLPELANQPYRIDLHPGVLVLPAPDPDYADLVRPLFGMSALLDGGLEVHLNAQTQRFSVWVPGDQSSPWALLRCLGWLRQQLRTGLRRWLGKIDRPETG